MNCLTSTVKYILYLFNIVFVICGILLIVLGSLMIGNMGDVTDVMGTASTDAIPIIIIILGCIIFLISFIGCCGAIRENACCLMIYAIIMSILFALQVALVVWIFVKRTDLLNTMRSAVNTAWNQNDDAHGYPMNVLQVTFDCCGLNSWEDYTNGVPPSCCGEVNPSATCPADIYTNRPGCSSAFMNFWEVNTNIIRWAGIGVALIELVAFTFACCVIHGARRSRREY